MHMTKDPRSASVPQGNTCRGVHRAIIEYLLEAGNDLDGKNMLDIPCGRAELISSLRRFFPKANVRGADLSKPEELTSEDFSQVDASRPFSVFPDMKFDYLLSVSGVMEFDNTLQFFESCHGRLRKGGKFIVTNDNIVSIRDRLAFCWLGTFRQFTLFVTKGQPTWKVIPISNMIRILGDAGFHIREVRYVSMKTKDWMMLPLALLVYPIQWLYVRFARTTMPLEERHRAYPFRSLLCRHYLIITEKVSA